MATVVLAVALVSCGDDDGGGDGDARHGGTGHEEEAEADRDGRSAPLDPAESGRPVAQPPRLRSSDGVLRVDVVASRRGVDIAGRTVTGRSLGEDFVAPTLVVRPGDTLALTIDNRLDARTNLHFHGMHVPPTGNGDNIFLAIEPGETFDYALPIPEDHRPGTFWYHAHSHGLSQEQVYGGVAGLLVVDGLTERLPPALRGIPDVAMALKDVRVTDHSILGHDIEENEPTLRVVNSQHRPVQQIAPGEVQLWRLANIGSDIFYDLELEGQRFVVLGEDGNPKWDVPEADHLVLPPGKRFDVLVTGPSPGEHVLKTRRYSQGEDVYPETELLTLASAGPRVATPPMPSSVADPAPLPASEVVERRTQVFGEDEETDEQLINGRSFDPQRVDVRPRLGTVEEWTLENTSDEQHPFHLHVNDFQVISVGGRPYDGGGLQDTVTLKPGEDVVVRMRFADFTGRTVFHCHILDHEDEGMMAVVDVVDDVE